MYLIFICEFLVYETIFFDYFSGVLYVPTTVHWIFKIRVMYKVFTKDNFWFENVRKVYL